MIFLEPTFTIKHFNTFIRLKRLQDNDKRHGCLPLARINRLESVTVKKWQGFFQTRQSNRTTLRAEPLLFLFALILLRKKRFCLQGATEQDGA